MISTRQDLDVSGAHDDTIVKQHGGYSRQEERITYMIYQTWTVSEEWEFEL